MSVLASLLMPNDIADLPPVWMPLSLFPPIRVAKHVFVQPEPPAEPEAVVVALIGRPDTAGNEPAALVAFTPDDAEALAFHLVRMAEVVRRAQ